MLYTLPLTSLLLFLRVSAFQVPGFIKRPQNALNGKAGKQPLDRDFDYFIKNVLSEQHTPGMAIAVVKDGVTYTKVNRDLYAEVYKMLQLLTLRSGVRNGQLSE